MKLLVHAVLVFLVLAGTSFSVSAQEEESLPQPSSTRRPNIIVIYADDLGYGEFPGSDIPTPNIDRIAEQGVRFTQAYVTHPTCKPSRAGLLTGCYQQRQGIEGNTRRRDFRLDPSFPTIAERLKRYGYATGMVGKWHLGQKKESQPNAYGFDYALTFIGGSANYFPIKPTAEYPTGNYPTMYRNGEPVHIQEYLTDAFGRDAVEFIKRHKEEPFFLYLPFSAVHTPLQAKKEDMEKFKNIQNKTRRVYAGMTEAMDRAVGNVLDALKTLNLEKDTLVVFASDNGGQTEKSTSGNNPLRGRKGQLYEGGIRVPFAIRWIGHISPRESYDHAISTLDIYPTALVAAGERINPEWELDGVNLIPYLNGKNRNMPHETLFWRGGGGTWFAVLQQGRWKLLLSKDNPKIQLYDLENDIGETKDLASEHPEKVKELQKLFFEWNSQMPPLRWVRHIPKSSAGFAKLREEIQAREVEGKGRKDETERSIWVPVFLGVVILVVGALAIFLRKGQQDNGSNG